MDPERWRRIQDVFHAAADLAPAERVAFLAAAGNNDVADDVRALLAADAQGDSLLDRDLGEVASRILADADIERGSRIGPYVLRARLGEGGMGVGYLAERTDLKSLVAIKLLRDAWLSPARRERFAVEQRALAQLNHPSIARLYDADTLPDGTPWFAMEYVDGVPLTRYAATNALSLSRLLDLFRAVGEAVRHAHQHAVIHRDLKPSNILVTRGGQPKLLDFGIAKELEGLDAEATWTRPELRLWTPGYAAPEQVEGRPQGVHTDVYGLGAILYELLTGRPPQSQAPDRPSLAGRTRLDARGVSWSDLDVLCLTALHPDPARRYRSVESLLRDLDHLVREEPLEARPDTWDYRVSKFVRRRWRPLALTAAIALGLVAVVSFYTLRLATARNQAVDEAARAQRIQGFMTGLFEGGDPNAGPADTLRVVELLERGERDARALTDPAARADLFETLGGIQRTLGNLDRADSLLHLALLTRRAMPKAAADDPHLSRTLVEIGLLRTDQSRYDEADSLVRLGLGRMRRRVPRDAAAIARATQSLATVLENRGEYDEAIAILEQAAREDSAAGLPPAERAVTLTLLANNHFYAGHYALAESLNRVVLASDRKIHGPRHPSVASDLINLGAIEQEWGHWAEAEDYYRQALA